ncbi:MAG: DUF177 domain-containing protein [Firmicutes bacterium]|jgi:uncharacterized protein|nr:DUF177 domain-containing protein [Bacillota bacterium]
MKSKKQFLVEIGALRRHPGSRRELHLEGVLAGLEVSFAAVAPDQIIDLEAVLEQVHEGILVTGKLHTRWHGECGRCLMPAEGALEAEIRELYAEKIDDEMVYKMNSEVMDLEPLVHDACILNLPLSPLCKSNCKGLCPMCGANLNEESCGCKTPNDPRWAPLSFLK